MKIILTIFSLIIFLAGVFGLPHGKNSFAEDDSDMLMEPDELPAPQYSVVRSESRVVPISGQFTAPRTHYTRSTFSRSNSRVETFEARAEQNFFPSYFRNQNPPNSHSRQPKSSRSAASIAGRYSATQNFDESILGSGDFAVVRGGTFYPDNDKNSQRFSSEEFFSGFYNNGHGRPSAHPLKTKKPAYYPEDPFEHFTDFADINTGNDGAFSHHTVIYANKNSTNPSSSHPRPNNIFEQLQLIDLEKEEDKKKISLTYNEKDSKLSKFKSKLSKTKVVKKYKKNLGPKFIDSSPDYIDPLLATS